MRLQSLCTIFHIDLQLPEKLRASLSSLQIASQGTIPAMPWSVGRGWLWTQK